MYHLILFAYLITLLVGSVAITVTRQGARSGRHIALRPLTGFLVCFNLMSLFGFTMTYLMITFQTAWEEGGAPVWAQLSTPLMRLLFFGLVWFMLLVERELRGQGGRNGSLRRLVTGAVSFVLCYLIVLALVWIQVGWEAVHFVDLVFALFAAAVLIAILVSLVRTGRRMPEGEERRLITSFALGYLVLFGLLVLILPLPESIAVAINLVVLVGINLFPVWWLARRVPLPTAGSTSSVLDDLSRLQALAGRYGLTEREREVAAQVLQGASNKEIEDRLFISLNTVKNHIYRIFRKVGVNSRSQLIRRVLDDT